MKKKLKNGKIDNNNTHGIRAYSRLLVCLVKTLSATYPYFKFFCGVLIPRVSLLISFLVVSSPFITTIMFEILDHTPAISSIRATLKALLSQTMRELQNFQAAQHLIEKKYLQQSQLVRKTESFNWHRTKAWISKLLELE